MEFVKNSRILICLLALSSGGLGCGGSSSLPEDLGEACGDLGSAYSDRGIESGYISEASSPSSPRQSPNRRSAVS